MIADAINGSFEALGGLFMPWTVRESECEFRDMWDEIG
jgi:hypothetical protein